jgi:hypothetical protein
VAKLVDALCSGRSVRKDVLVRIQSWAQMPFTNVRGFFFDYLFSDDVFTRVLPKNDWVSISYTTDISLYKDLNNIDERVGFQNKLYGFLQF